jgi:soluble lytic murein transglycosylase-like protein
MIKYLLLMMVFLFTEIGYTDPTVELTGYITHFFTYKIGKKSMIIYPKRLEKALSYIPTIIAECGEDIDPLLIAVIISLESSWKAEVRGELGEHGLMQIMPRYGKGFDLSNPREQIRAGIDHFRNAMAMCGGDAKAALNAYGCGQCQPYKQFVKRRWRYYNRMKRRFN